MVWVDPILVELTVLLARRRARALKVAVEDRADVPNHAVVDRSGLFVERNGLAARVLCRDVVDFADDHAAAVATTFADAVEVRLIAGAELRIGEIGCRFRNGV